MSRPSLAAPGSATKAGGAFLLGLSLLLLTLPLASCQSSDAREAWFAGPAESVDPDTSVYYDRPRYDLATYAGYDSLSFFASDAGDPFTETRDDDPLWVDGAARGVLEASMRTARRKGAADEPSAALYLMSPSTYRERRASPRLRLAYPAEGALFPPNLCPIRIDWEDETNDLWQVAVGLAGETTPRWTAVTEAHAWRFPADTWRQVKALAQERDAWVQVKGIRRPAAGATPATVQASKVVHFRVSDMAADDFLVYRMVTPPFNARKTPSTYSRDIRSFGEEPFLLARNNYCYNCHTFSNKTGDSGMLSVQVRYMSPGSKLPVYLGIYDISAQEGWKAKLPFDIQMSTFMAWSPDGRYLGFSANQQLVTFEPTVFETQFAGQPTSDLAIYDAKEQRAFLLPGAADDGHLQMLPRWSLDGKSLVYCSAPVGSHPAETLYSMYHIPFDDGAGGAAEPVPGASDNGRSNYFPRFSPDGRWLSFCQSDGGVLMKSSSDIYVLPADFSGTPHRLESNVEHAADSWHSWSSKGHWLVFASKRDDGIYARLYFTHVDAHGHASPAVRLPLLDEPLASFNIPEFVAKRPHIDEPDLFEAVRVEAPAREVALSGRPQ